jgi:hypothetical protein
MGLDLSTREYSQANYFIRCSNSNFQRWAKKIFKLEIQSPLSLVQVLGGDSRSMTQGSRYASRRHVEAEKTLFE